MSSLGRYGHVAYVVAVDGDTSERLSGELEDPWDDERQQYGRRPTVIENICENEKDVEHIFFNPSTGDYPIFHLVSLVWTH